MSTRNLTCIGCPMGCQLTAELAGGEVVSVRTADEVPKEKVFDVARALGAVTVRAPLHIGDVVLADAAGTGVAVVATKEVAAK